MRPKSNKSEDAIPENSWLFDQQALQKYVLLACQDFEGGLKDKPGKYVPLLQHLLQTELDIGRNCAPKKLPAKMGLAWVAAISHCKPPQC